MPDDEGMFSPPWSSGNSESRPKKQRRKGMSLLEKDADLGLFMLWSAGLLVLCMAVWMLLSWVLHG